MRLHNPEELEDALAVLDDVVLEHGRRELGLSAGSLGGRGRRAADKAVSAGGDPLQLRQGLSELQENTTVGCVNPTRAQFA